VNARLVVGVSDAPLLRKKVLREMMQPLPLRLALVADFVNAVAPHLRLELTALQDGYGPAGSDAELQAIVVSAESLPGGHACNAKRTEGGLPPLEVLCLPLVDEAGEGGEVSEEAKLSSSSVRKARLAVLQRGDETTWARVTPPGTPYVVGLTGGIASGKSTVARHLREALGATCLDCDQLAHEVCMCTACTPQHTRHARAMHTACPLHTQAYAPGTAACAALVAAFGSEIVGEGGAIDRRALGAKVFADKAAMARLCEIAWPATAALAAERIAGCGEGLVVMEAAVMLEAGCAAAPCQPRVSPMSATCQHHASPVH
jgi:phosphopantetheine adenylyltransferase/dephospho-CoA kinase